MAIKKNLKATACNSPTSFLHNRKTNRRILDLMHKIHWWHCGVDDVLEERELRFRQFLRYHKGSVHPWWIKLEFDGSHAERADAVQAS